MADGEKFITDIGIQNFKAFKDLKLENLSNFNLFIGHNNIGKTSVLEAITTSFCFFPKQFLQSFIWEARRENLENIRDLYMFFRNYEPANSISLSSSFRNKNKIKLEIKQNTELDIPKINCKLCDENHRNKFIEWNVKRTDNLNRNLKITDPIAKALEHTLAQHQKGFTSSFGKNHSSEDYEKFDNKFSPKVCFIGRDFYLAREEADLIRARSTKQEILDFAKKIDFRIEDITVDGNLALLYVQNIDKPIPINHLGIGFIKVLKLQLAILMNGIDVILFDEITDGLSPQTVKILLKYILPLIVDRNIQIFATTHSWDILREIAEYQGEYPEALAVYQMSWKNGTQVRKIPFRTIQSSFPDFIDFREDD